MGFMEQASKVSAQSRTALFRSEAIDYLKSQAYGNVILTSSKAQWRMVYTVGLLVLAILMLLLFLSTSRKAQSEGVLLPKSGIIRLAPGSFGVISDMRVKEGQVVAAGSVLFVISRLQATKDTAAPDVQVSRLLEQRRSSFGAEQGRADEQARQRMSAAKRRVDELAGEIAHASRQIEIQRTRTALSQTVLTKYSILKGQGFISPLQLAEKQAELLDQRQRLVELERAHAGRKREHAEALAVVDDLALQVDRDAEALRRSLGTVEQEIAQHDGQRETVIRAPIAGTVTLNEATLGQRVTPDTVVLTLLPAATELEAELYVPSRSIGFIRPGMSVMLRYRAYPYQKFGQHRAVVREVAAMSSRLTDASVSLPPGSEPMYRIRLRLQNQSIKAYGAMRPLKAGMALDASIVLEERQLYEWILEPLYSISGRT